MGNRRPRKPSLTSCSSNSAGRSRCPRWPCAALAGLSGAQDVGPQKISMNACARHPRVANVPALCTKHRAAPDELRPLRLQLELLKPERILHEQGIRSTGGLRQRTRERCRDGRSPSGVLERQAPVTRRCRAAARACAQSPGRTGTSLRASEAFRAFIGRVSSSKTAVISSSSPGWARHHGGRQLQVAFEVGARLDWPQHHVLLHERDTQPSVHVPGFAFRFHFRAAQDALLFARQGLQWLPGGYGNAR